MRICGLRFSKAVHTRAKAAVGHHKRARARGYAARRGRPRRAPQPDVMDASSAGKSRDLCVARWRRLLPPRQGLSQTARAGAMPRLRDRAAHTALCFCTSLSAQALSQPAQGAWMAPCPPEQIRTSLYACCKAYVLHLLVAQALFVHSFIASAGHVDGLLW